MSQFISDFHQARDKHILMAMNDVMMILLIKHGCFDPMEALNDVNFVIRQRELLETINKAKS